MSTQTPELVFLAIVVILGIVLLIKRTSSSSKEETQPVEKKVEARAFTAEAENLTLRCPHCRSTQIDIKDVDLPLEEAIAQCSECKRDLGLYVNLQPEPIVERTHFFKQVHGIFHKNSDGSRRQTVIARCRVGEPIDLKPEPNNAYDSDAIMVCRKSGEQLGYLPTGHHMATDGILHEDYIVIIAEIYPIEDKPRSKGCRLRIGVPVL
jgi:hypothetical protein